MTQWISLAIIISQDQHVYHIYVYQPHRPVVVEEEGFQVGEVREGVRSQLLNSVVAQVPVDVYVYVAVMVMMIGE